MVTQLQGSSFERCDGRSGVSGRKFIRLFDVISEAARIRRVDRGAGARVSWRRGRGVQSVFLA